MGIFKDWIFKESITEMLPCDDCGLNSYSGWLKYTDDGDILGYLLACKNCKLVVSNCSLFEQGRLLNESDFLGRD